LILNRGIIDLSSGVNTSVEVTTEAADHENDVLTHMYDVSGGSIVGVGRNVIWRLDGSAPGRYSIRAWVDDGMGDCGRSLTQTIVVVDSEN